MNWKKIGCISSIFLFLFGIGVILLTAKMSALYEVEAENFSFWFPNYHVVLALMAESAFMIYGIISFIFILLFFIWRNSLKVLWEKANYQTMRALFTKSIRVTLRTLFSIWQKILRVEWTKEYKLSLIIFVITLAIGELALRELEFRPGKLSTNIYFQAVDSFHLKQGFVTDSLGVLKVTDSAAKNIKQCLEDFSKFPARTNYWHIDEGQVSEVYYLKKNFVDIHKNEIQNEFTEYLKKLNRRDTTQLSKLEKAIIHYTQNPINEAGFRSIPFQTYPEAKKSVLLLGDSFTWGHITENKTSSFADILLSLGFAVYNTGISGTDMPQYLAIARKLIPELKPDVVIVNFFLGNDVNYYPRPLKPFQPILYSTNAGSLLSCPQGEYFEDPTELYELLHSWNYIPQTNFFNKLCSQTVITTLMWKILVNNDVINANAVTKFNDYTMRIRKLKESIPFANQEVEELKELAKMHNTQFILSIIPELRQGQLTTPKDYQNLFLHQTYLIPTTLTVTDYHKNNGHFNEAGHKKYAKYLKDLIND